LTTTLDRLAICHQTAAVERAATAAVDGTSIQAAQRGDAGEIETLLKLLRNPFAEQPGYENYAAPAPDWARDLEVSCSS